MSAVLAAERPPEGAGQHRLGVFLQLGAAVAFSLAGFFTRLIAMDAPTLLFWRGIFAGLSVVAVIAWMHRGRVWATARAAGMAGLGVAALTTLSMTSFIWALRLTSVAEVSVIYAAVPLVAAALGRLLLGEQAGPRVLLACAATVAGVAIMVGGGRAAGHWLGDALAVVMTLASGLFMVMLRWRRGRSMLPAMALASFLTAILACPWAAPLHASALDIGWAALFGVTQLGLGLVLMTVGARLVTATETALYGTLDAPLAPLWVWAAFGEAPGLSTVAGGALVMAAVIGFIMTETRPRTP